MGAEANFEPLPFFNIFNNMAIVHTIIIAIVQVITGVNRP